MNKQELIEKYKAKGEARKNTPIVAISDVLTDLRQLDEQPEIVKIPQVIAEYIKQKKDDDYHLLGAMIEIRSHKNKEIDEWFEEDDNMELFARAWLDGYEVEKEKRYVVKIPVVNQYLVRVKDENFLGFLSSKLRTYLTRKELEEAGFGWVFDCEGIDIEEVTE